MVRAAAFSQHRGCTEQRHRDPNGCGTEKRSLVMATYTGTQHSSSRRQLVMVGLAALAVGLGVSHVDLHRHRNS
jgi:hypothetical protein